MNAAIADGHDLGWKLGWVLRGWAREELLETYEAERRPVVAHNVERSIDERGSYREPVDETHIDLGGRIAHLWVEADAGRVSTLDLVGDGLTLFTGPDADIDAPTPTNGSAPLTSSAAGDGRARSGNRTRPLAARQAERRSREEQAEIPSRPCIVGQAAAGGTRPHRRRRRPPMTRR